jgi:hypothetical protein
LELHDSRPRIDLDALIDYIETLAQPFSAVIEGRIQRLD